MQSGSRFGGKGSGWTMEFRFEVLLFLMLLALSGCGSGSSSSDGESPSDSETDALLSQESELRAWLDDYSSDTDFVLLLESQSGTRFDHAVGEINLDSRIQSASTSKLVTASVILALVEDGRMSLQDQPQDYLDHWPSTGSLSEITLEQLLNFSSGLNQTPLCVYWLFAEFNDCVQTILDVNSAAVPGMAFYYGSAPMQVAGAMAIQAAVEADVLTESTAEWTHLFGWFQQEFQVFQTSEYNVPSNNNPLLAGGMHWTGREYLAFLNQLLAGQILSESTLTQLRRNLGGQLTILNSPAVDAGEAWRYGYGVWLEDCISSDTQCISGRISSPGAYGAYPFVDFERQYVGILVRQGALGSFSEGLSLVKSANSMLENWAELAQ